MQPTREQVAAGQAVYTKRVLSAYDILVLGISNRYIWKCPTSSIEALYNANVSANHLEVGVGTGYFPDHCQFPAAQPRIALMDLNPNTLEVASHRIRRYQPETYEQNVLEVLRGSIKPFDSVGINYLLHCVPGAMQDKAVMFDHLRAVMNPGCRVFGSTILQGGVPRSWTARQLMNVYNRQGIFCNANDHLQNLHSALTARFDNVSVTVEGCVALFSGDVS